MINVEHNRFQNYATRQVQLATGIRTNVLNFNVDTGVNWQAWIFSNDVGDKSTFVEFVLSGSFGTSGSIETRIGGGSVGGEVITGTGACKVFATGEGNNLLSVWFTPEQTSSLLPPKSQLQTIALVGGVFNFGYPPFRRYHVAIRTTDIFDVVFKDDTGTTIYQETVNPASVTTRTFMNDIYHPPNATMELVSSVVNQNFIVTHYL
tara:strand:- start:225 stop:842 length:618 start_codon:yes stop_codon:yes gene_type:complete